LATRTADHPAPPVARTVLLTPAERAAVGKAARAEVPRSSHGGWDPAADRRDPVELLEQQAETRVPELVPIRYGRMLTSPFAFYRGAAGLMATDLAATPSSGLTAQLCGDAHLSNFGGFASPDRDLLFDLNDFDETLPGPWEWDVKRLATSFAIAGRDHEFDDADRRLAVLAAVRVYREAMRRFAEMRNLEVWYARLDLAAIRALWAASAKRAEAKGFERSVAKARAKDSLRALSKLTHRLDGELRIISDPPLIVPLEELLPDDEGGGQAEAWLRGILDSYTASLDDEYRRLLDGYRLVHCARKVVGVGSVGTRAWIVLLTGRDEEDPLFLQVKEAQASVLEPHAAPCRFENQGQRVVEGQRLMQAASDILLGWVRALGIDGKPHDYYVRQLWDQKASAPIELMTPHALATYAEMCGATLARAHARSGDRIAIASYLGGGTRFDEAIAEFAEAYADQSERDYAALQAAVEAGRVTARTGL
jgi:uncharacterized protein (DUF2252 family)